MLALIYKILSRPVIIFFLFWKLSRTYKWYLEVVSKYISFTKVLIERWTTAHTTASLSIMFDNAMDRNLYWRHSSSIPAVISVSLPSSLIFGIRHNTLFCLPTILQKRQISIWTLGSEHAISLQRESLGMDTFSRSIVSQIACISTALLLSWQILKPIGRCSFCVSYCDLDLLPRLIWV